MTQARQGGRPDTAIRSHDSPTMRGNKKQAPTVETIHSKWWGLWRRLHELQEANQGKPFSEFSALQIALSEEVVRDLSAIMGTHLCGVCSEASRKPCQHFARAG